MSTYSYIMHNEFSQYLFIGLLHTSALDVVSIVTILICTKCKIHNKLKEGHSGCFPEIKFQMEHFTNYSEMKLKV